MVHSDFKTNSLLDHFLEKLGFLTTAAQYVWRAGKERKRCFQFQLALCGRILARCSAKVITVHTILESSIHF